MKAINIILIFIFIGLLVCSGNLILGQDGCTPQPPLPKDKSRHSGSGGPAGDTPDESYSFSSGLVREFNLFPEAVVLTEGYWQEAMKLYGGLKAAPEFTANALFESTPFLIIPTSGLFGLENDSVFKASLQEYVRLGGSIIVFSNQFGSHIDKIVPVPEGGEPAFVWFSRGSKLSGLCGLFQADAPGAGVHAHTASKH